MSQKTITLVAAMDQQRAIGFSGDMPWHLPEDLKHFKKITMGKPIVMGRKTFESIGKALPGRQNVVISRQHDFEAPGCDIADSLEAALAQCDGDQVMVIGGGEIYRLAMPMADTLMLTEIDLCVAEADTYFPEYSIKNWQEVDRDCHASESSSPLHYCFVEYRRR